MTFQTFTGSQYLQIDIASNFGLNKETWDDRLLWFKKNEPMLEELITGAKEPALYYAGVQAWRKTQAGEPTGYMISLDATSSGLQLLAVLTGDRQASKLCNVVSDFNAQAVAERRDAYTLIYKEILTRINDTAKITRDDTKAAIMTALYSSKAVPKQVFGEGKLLDVFYNTLSDMAPAAWELNEAMLSFWDPNAVAHEWTLPDNFHVKVKVMNQVKEGVHFLNEPFDVFYNINSPTDEGRSLGANTIHSIDGMIVREMTRRCDYDARQVQIVRKIIDDQPTNWGKSTVTEDDKMVVILWDQYQKSGYLSARILDHLCFSNVGHVDVEVIRELIDSLPAKPFKVISIHD